MSNRARTILAFLGVAALVGATLLVAPPHSLSQPAGAAEARAASANETYVTQVYKDLLGRGPDSAGLAYWASLLDSGVPRPPVAWSLVVSNEYRGNVIGGMYQQYLGRSPDAAGLSYWVGQVASGMTFEQFQALLIGSDEYYVSP